MKNQLGIPHLRADRWETGWLLLGQALILAVAWPYLFSESVFYSSFTSFRLTLHVHAFPLSLTFPYYEHLNALPFGGSWGAYVDRLASLPARDAGLILTFDAVATAIVVLAFTLWVWPWVPQPYRAFGWDAIALAGAYVFLAMCGLADFEINEMMRNSARSPGEATLAYLQRFYLPVQLLYLAPYFAALGLIYGHLGRLLLGPDKKPPEGSSPAASTTKRV
ncbi:MAG: hypothetical protein AAGK14_01690 [Verrucomicrobiota bacterium]